MMKFLTVRSDGKYQMNWLNWRSHSDPADHYFVKMSDPCIGNIVFWSSPAERNELDPIQSKIPATNWETFRRFRQ
jgi:hypothetical protein